jgi:pimeloyl-ACP methyl ester carboxylesterase
MLPELAANRQVIAVELQSHGHTKDIDRPFSFEQDADDVAALLKQQLHVERADFFGFSNGGMSCLQDRFPASATREQARPGLHALQTR